MSDTLAMLFGKKRVAKKPAAKKAKASPAKVKSAGKVVIRGKERKLYRGKKGGLFYRSKGRKVYVDKKSAKRGHRGDARRKTHRLSPHKKKKMMARKSPGKKAAGPKKVYKMKYGYGLGQPFLLDMMGPVM